MDQESNADRLGIPKDRREWWTPIPVNEVRIAFETDIPSRTNSMLILGVGDGREIVEYVHAVPGIERVVGIDIDDSGFDIARRNIHDTGIWDGELVLKPMNAALPGSLVGLEGERFDVVTSVGLWTNIPVFGMQEPIFGQEDLMFLIANAYTSLVEGGSYVISDYVLNIDERPWWRDRYGKAMDVMMELFPERFGLMYGCFFTKPFDIGAEASMALMTPDMMAEAFRRGEVGRVVRHWDERIFISAPRMFGFKIASLRKQWIAEHGPVRLADEPDILENILIRAVRV